MVKEKIQKREGRSRKRFRTDVKKDKMEEGEGRDQEEPTRRGRERNR